LKSASFLTYKTIYHSFAVHVIYSVQVSQTSNAQHDIKSNSSEAAQSTTQTSTVANNSTAPEQPQLRLAAATFYKTRAIRKPSRYAN